MHLSVPKQQGACIYGLSSHTTHFINEPNNERFIIYVLGNETDGVSNEVQNLCDKSIAIPMNNGVESLNVAVTASLLAFREVALG